MLDLKNIATVVPMAYHGFDAHSGAHMLRAAPEQISPFIGVDSYTMPQPFFGPHPHAGMSAVSLMLPEAEGGFINRDSLGDHSLIRPGDLHWTQAGRGMMHEEVPAEPGTAARGMQIFVNLKRDHKQAAPVAFKVKHEDMPVLQLDGGSIRVVTGSLNGLDSPINQDERWLTRVNLFDVTVKAGASVDIPVAAGDNAFFIIRSGNARIEAKETTKETTKEMAKEISQSALLFEQADTEQRVRLTAGTQGLRGVLFSGTPIDEPVVSGGPFTGNTAADITAYKQAFARGDMGQLERSF